MKRGTGNYALHSKEVDNGAWEGLPRLSEMETPNERETELQRMSERESSVASGVSRMSETTGSTVDYLRGGLDNPNPNVMINMLLTLMQSTQEREIKMEAERRRIRDENLALRQQENEEMLERMEKQRLEDVERMKQQLESERVWKESLSLEKEKRDKINQALKTFPKISSATTLSSQLDNFSTLMNFLDVPDAKKTEKLPGASGPNGCGISEPHQERGHVIC